MRAIDRSSSERDRRLLLARRLRVGLVSAGVLGSLGVAGFVAGSTHVTRAASPAPSTPSTTGSSRTLPRSTGDDSFSQEQEGSDDGAASGQLPGQLPGQTQGQTQGQLPGQSQGQVPNLLPGSGSAQGSTGGS